jgi:hypothetical protein
MSDETPKDNATTSKIRGKLALLLGSGLAILNGSTIVDAPKMVPMPSDEAKNEIVTMAQPRPLPPKLTIRQFQSGYKMIAQHDSHSSHSSHSSHDSHGSHSSHSSHDSHASHSSHSSHTSHSSHVSGGFV